MQTYSAEFCVTSKLFKCYAKHNYILLLCDSANVELSTCIALEQCSLNMRWWRSNKTAKLSWCNDMINHPIICNTRNSGAFNYSVTNLCKAKFCHIWGCAILVQFWCNIGAIFVQNICEVMTQYFLRTW